MEQFLSSKYSQKWIITFLLGIFLIGFFLLQIKLSTRLVQDFDEGVYVTTFLLIDKGFSAYNETFFSQPPGFLLSVYPGFLLLGKTLSAARIIIGLWSLVGLISIIWICMELKKPLMSLLVIGVLFLIPFYSENVSVFQSDMLPSVFSLISFGALLRFVSIKKLYWLCISSVFFTAAFITKFNIFLFLPILSSLLYIYRKDSSLKNLFISGGIYAGIFIFLTLLVFISFGIGEVYANTIALRTAATSSSGDSLLRIVTSSYSFLVVLIFTGVLLLIKRDKFSYPLVPLLLWTGSVLSVFLFYKPLFPHHMSMLTIPLVLLFSYLFTVLFEQKKRYVLFTICLFLFSTVSYVMFSFSIPNKHVLNQEQMNVVKSITNNSSPQDAILTDDEILYGESGRLPHPQLSDVSFVRVNSNNLSPTLFKDAVNQSKPKLIIPRTGRLVSIDSYPEIIKGYDVLIVDGGQDIYIRKENK